jgi:tripartite-type tricarboxylate transporter receptor subunit TctC
VKTGKLRALGVTTAKRNAALPDVPTVGETVKGYEASVFYGVGGPQGMSPEVVEVLNKAFNAALADPKIQKRIAELGAEPTPMTPAEFGKLVADETEKWGKVVKAANISVE